MAPCAPISPCDISRKQLHEFRTLSHQTREPNTAEGTPDRWKLFGSYDQSPWFHNMKAQDGFRGDEALGVRIR